MMQMNRQWMNADRQSSKYIAGMQAFLEVAKANKNPKGFMCCPCFVCRFDKDYSDWGTLHLHLIKNRFIENYVLWTRHDERGVVMEENEEEDDDNNLPDWATGQAFANTVMEDVDEEVIPEDGHVDDLGQVLKDAQRDCENDNEKAKLQRMIQDHRQLLYPDCKQGHKKLGTTLEMLQWKEKYGVSDKAFKGMLKIVKDKLPENNELPSPTYEAKQTVCPLGLEVRKIHACPNDCILYRGKEHENLEAYPVCKVLCYKIQRDDDPDGLEGTPPKTTKVSGKVMWYFPIIPRLKRLFRNKEHAKLMTWHKSDRKHDHMLRHPTDGSQWRKIDRKYKDISGEARNIRFGLSTNGFNPFDEFSSGHSTWPVTLCMFNLPGWMCMKQKFIMMLVLIQGPKQPGDDIDVYLRPLVDELLLLWKKEGVCVWDENKQGNFNLQALLFITIRLAYFK
jgi:hypothetical protein